MILTSYFAIKPKDVKGGIAIDTSGFMAHW